MSVPACGTLLVPTTMAGGAFLAGGSVVVGAPVLEECTKAYEKAVIERICVH